MQNANNSPKQYDYINKKNKSHLIISMAQAIKEAREYLKKKGSFLQ